MFNTLYQYVSLLSINVQTTHTTLTKLLVQWLIYLADRADLLRYLTTLTGRVYYKHAQGQDRGNSAKTKGILHSGRLILQTGQKQTSQDSRSIGKTYGIPVEMQLYLSRMVQLVHVNKSSTVFTYKLGFPMSCLQKKFQDFSRTFQNPQNVFPLLSQPSNV